VRPQAAKALWPWCCRRLITRFQTDPSCHDPWTKTKVDTPRYSSLLGFASEHADATCNFVMPLIRCGSGEFKQVVRRSPTLGFGDQLGAAFGERVDGCGGVGRGHGGHHGGVSDAQSVKTVQGTARY
jgi:hypothetical protein